MIETSEDTRIAWYKVTSLNMYHGFYMARLHRICTLVQTFHLQLAICECYNMRIKSLCHPAWLVYSTCGCWEVCFKYCYFTHVLQCLPIHSNVYDVRYMLKHAVSFIHLCNRFTCVKLWSQEICVTCAQTGMLRSVWSSRLSTLCISLLGGVLPALDD